MTKDTGEIRDRYTPERVLENHRELSQALPHMNEAELEAALKVERKRKGEEKRKDFLLRLHRKYTRFRQEREFKELMED